MQVRTAFLLVSIILFILAAIPVGNGRLQAVGLALFAASFAV